MKQTVAKIILRVADRMKSILPSQLCWSSWAVLLRLYCGRSYPQIIIQTTLNYNHGICYSSPSITVFLSYLSSHITLFSFVYIVNKPLSCPIYKSYSRCNLAALVLSVLQHSAALTHTHSPQNRCTNRSRLMTLAK